MARKTLVLSLLMLTILTLSVPITRGADKIKLGTGFKDWALYYLPVLAAEEGGFFRKNNLEVEWVPFGTVITMMQAVVARELYVGLNIIGPMVQGIAGGVPVVAVADLHPRELFNLWVRKDSPIRKPADLKGGRIGISRLGGPTDIYARFLVRVFGIEKDVRIVALGSVPSVWAGVEAGHVSAFIQPPDLSIQLKVKGLVREVASIADFLPKDWALIVVFGQRTYIKDKPETVRRLVKAFVEANNFIMDNPSWAIGKLRSVSALSEESARELYPMYQFSRDGKINRKGLENVLNFLIEYGMVSREKVPPLDELYTMKFTD